MNIKYLLTIMDKLISQNNKGALLIERGDYSNAVRLLSAGILSFKRMRRRIQQTNAADKNKRLIAATGSSTDIDDLMRRMPSGSAEDNNATYCYPLYLPKNSNTTFEEVPALFATTLTFNLALANHFYAIKSGNIMSFRAAARLYKHGFHLERVRGNLSVSPFFLMATLNNLGQLYQVTEQRDRSEKCFRQLLSTLMYVVVSKGARPSDLERYFGNTCACLWKEGQNCASAA